MTYNPGKGGCCHEKENAERNLLMDEKNELKNRYMHIRWNKTTHLDEKQHMEQHIESEDSLLEILDQKGISSKMKANISEL